MNKKKYIVDRIEGNYVILEDDEGKLCNVDKKGMIGNLKEGCVLYKKDNFYYIDDEATRLRKEEIDQLMKGLWKE